MANEYMDMALAEESASDTKAATPANNNEYMDMALAEQRQQDAALRGNLTLHTNGNPDDYAKQKKIAGYLGQPVAAVEALPQQSDQQAAITHIDNTTRDTPILRQRYTDADFTKLAHDDSGTLAGIERWAQNFANDSITNTPKYLAEDSYAALQGFAGAGNKLGQFAGIVGGAIPTAYDKAASVFTGKTESSASDWWFRNMVDPWVNNASVFDLSPNAGFSQKAAHTAGSLLETLALITATGGGAAPEITAATTVPEMVGGAVAHGAKSMALPALSDAVDTGRRVYQETGDGAAAAKAAEMQYATSTLNGILPLSAPGNLVTRLASGAVSGAYTGELSRQAMNWAMPDSMQQGFSSDDMILSALTGSIMGGVMGPHSEPNYHEAIRQTYVDAAKAEAAVKQFDGLKAISEISAGSKLRERDPAAFNQYVQDVTENGSLPAVYVDAKTLVDVLHQSGVSDKQITETMPDTAAQLHEALQTQGDVRISTADYATHIAGSPVDEALLQHLKTSPDGQTYAEAQAYYQDQQATLKTQAERIIAEKSKDDASKAESDAVFNQIHDQLQATGRYTPDVAKTNATIATALYTSSAERAGMTPTELLAQHPLNVAAEGSGFAQGEKTLADVRQQWTDAGIENAIHEKNGIITLSKIVVPESERGAGKGSAAMQSLIDYADRSGQHIDLSPSGDFGGNKKQLIDFYKRFGFVENKGSNRAFTTSESMYREAPGKRLEQATRGAYDPATHTIALLKDADLSTFTHELGHHALEMTSDLAGRDNAAPGLRDDMNTLLKWFGVDSHDTWNKMSLEEKRGYHEQFAEGFEKYLFEGKSPSLEMQPVFSRIRSWMVQVYKSLTNLGVELSPDVRGVFDRLVASQDAITRAEQVRGYEPLFKTADAAGVSSEQFRGYMDLGKEATDQAVGDMQSRSLRDMKWLTNAKSKALRELQKQSAAARKAVKAQVTDEVMREPINQAREFLKNGTLIEKGRSNAERKVLDRIAGGSTKLDLGDLKQMYGDDPAAPWRYLSTGKKGLATAKDGLHPDLVADMFGFNSGDGLVRALLEGEDPKAKIEGLTDQRMLEQHGELTDPQSIERAAEAAIHNETRARFMATGLKILTKSPMPAQQIAKAAKEAADAAIAAKKVGELRPLQYSAAEARSNKSAIKLAPTDPARAAEAQRAALLNNRLARAAADTVEEVRKGVQYLGKFDKDSIRNKIALENREQIDDLLSRFDLRATQPDEPTRAQVNLQTWLQSQMAAGYEPAITSDMLNPDLRTPYKELSVEQFRGLVAAVKAIEHVGREQKTITIAGQRLDLDNLVAQQFLPKLRERGDKFSLEQLVDKPEERFSNPIALSFDHLKAWMRGVGAQLKPQEFKRNQYDLHELAGPFGKYIYDQVLGANYRKVDMLKGLSDDFAKMGDELGKEWQQSLLNFVENKTLLDPDKSKDAGQPVLMKISRAKMLGMALHVGNESNFDKMTRGWDWHPTLVWKFLQDNMTAKDWQAVQSVWDLYEKHWPDVQAMQTRLGNTMPEKVEPRPFNTPYGEMKGGYAAIKYDAQRSKRGEKAGAIKAINPVDGLFGRDYFRTSSTTNGSLNARNAGYIDRVDLDYHTVAQTMKETIHDLAYRESLMDVNKIIEHPDFRLQFRKTYGNEAYKSMRDWIGKLANSEVIDRDIGELGRVLSYARTGIVINGIGFRATTVLKHGGSAGIKTMGYFAGGGEKYLASRFAAMGTNYKNEIRGAQEKFPEIRARLLQQDRDYKQLSAHLFESETGMEKAHRFGHAAVAWSDMMTAVPTAWAAYDRAISEGIPVSQGGTGKPMTEAEAVSYASKIVREAHGSNVESARSMALNTNNEALKMFTTLYGFMNNTYGQMADVTDKLRTGNLSKPPVLARAFAALIVPALWAEYLTTGGPDEETGVLKWMAEAIGNESAGMVPFVRDAASMVKGYRSAGQVGIESWMSTMVRAGADIVHLVEGKEVKKPIRDIADAVGQGLHIPGLGQGGTSVQYLSDVATGKENPESVAEFAKGIVTGHGATH